MLTILDQLRFQRAGRIYFPYGRRTATFDLRCEYKNGARASERGWVYVWVKIKDGHEQACYVGKAGKTLIDRCRQHEAGFRYSITGIAHNKRLQDFLFEDCKNEIVLYARRSDECTVLYENGISMCEAEERAMIQKLRRLGTDLWNAA